MPSAGGVDALVERHGLSSEVAEKLRFLLEALVGDPAAPTAVRRPDRALDDHLADALVALEVSEVRAAGEACDLGSGAGLPGLPLAIALPDANFALLESSRRKCEFITRAVAACAIANAEVVNARAELWSDGLRRFDLVTARALARLEVVLEWAAPLLSVGGTLVVWRGRRDSAAEAAAAEAGEELGLQACCIRRVVPYEGVQHRYLHVWSKVMETPDGFPRRPGMALKRPLGSSSHRKKGGSDRVRR